MRREPVRRLSEPEAEVRSLPTTQSNEALVRRVLEGDRWAADALYRRHAPDVFRVATLLLGRVAEVDDVVQDAFVRSFQKLETLRDRETYGGWVVRIAANLARSRLRRRGLMRRLGLDRGELSRIGDFLRGLPADLRVAWTLRRVEGWPLAEIAEAVDASLATVKRRVAAADEALDEHVSGGRR